MSSCSCTLCALDRNTRTVHRTPQHLSQYACTGRPLHPRLYPESRHQLPPRNPASTAVIFIPETKLLAFFSRPAAFPPPHCATQALLALPSHRPRLSQVLTTAAALHSWPSHHRAAAFAQPLCRRPTTLLPTTACPPQPPLAHSRLDQGFRVRVFGPSRCRPRCLRCISPFSLRWQGPPAVRVHTLSPPSFPRNSVANMAGSATRGLAVPHGLTQLNSFTRDCGSLRKLNPPYTALSRLFLSQERDCRREVLADVSVKLKPTILLSHAQQEVAARLAHTLPATSSTSTPRACRSAWWRCPQ